MYKLVWKYRETSFHIYRLFQVSLPRFLFSFFLWNQFLLSYFCLQAKKLSWRHEGPFVDGFCLTNKILASFYFMHLHNYAVWTFLHLIIQLFAYFIVTFILVKQINYALIEVFQKKSQSKMKFMRFLHPTSYIFAKLQLICICTSIKVYKYDIRYIRKL